MKAENSQEIVTIFAAASLTDVLPDLTTAWRGATNAPKPRLSFGPSATIARQVAAGAPAHIVLSANPEWITFLAERGLLASQPKAIARNLLVLVQPGSGTITETDLTPKMLDAALKGKRFAIADPAIAPAGAYARSYLERVNLWEMLKPQAAMGSNVRQTLVLVERGGMPGFVYATDARRSKRVNIVGVVPGSDLPPIIYTAGRTRKADTNADSLFLFLISSEAAPIWIKHGFQPAASK